MIRIVVVVATALLLACSTGNRLLSSPYTDGQVDRGGIPRDALERSLSLEEATSLFGPDENSLGRVVLSGAYLPGDQLWQYRLTRPGSGSSHTTEVGVILVRDGKVVARVILESLLIQRAGEDGV